MLPNLTPTWPHCSLPSLALNLFWDTAVSKFKNHDHIQYSRSNHRRPKIFFKGTKIFCSDSTLARSRSKLGWDEFPFYVLFMQFGFNWQSIKSFGEAWLSSVPCMDDPKFGPRAPHGTILSLVQENAQVQWRRLGLGLMNRVHPQQSPMN